MPIDFKKIDAAIKDAVMEAWRSAYYNDEYCSPSPRKVQERIIADVKAAVHINLPRQF